MAKLYTYDTTYEREDAEGNLTESMGVRFKYNFQPGLPARIRYDEHDHPAEAAEIEVTNIHIEVTTMDGGRRWFDATPDDHEMLLVWAREALFDEMVTEAIDVDTAERDAAAEHAYETRRELLAMDDER